MLAGAGDWLRARLVTAGWTAALREAGPCLGLRAQPACALGAGSGLRAERRVLWERWVPSVGAQRLRYPSLILCLLGFLCASTKRTAGCFWKRGGGDLETSGAIFAVAFFVLWK